MLFKVKCGQVRKNLLNGMSASEDEAFASAEEGEEGARGGSGLCFSSSVLFDKIKYRLVHPWFFFSFQPKLMSYNKKKIYIIYI